MAVPVFEGQKKKKKKHGARSLSFSMLQVCRRPLWLGFGRRSTASTNRVGLLPAPVPAVRRALSMQRLGTPRSQASGKLGIGNVNALRAKNELLFRVDVGSQRPETLRKTAFFNTA